ELYKERHNTQNGKIHVDFAIHAEYTINDNVTKGYADRIRQYADEAVLQVHVSETEKEHNECIERHGMTPMAWLESMGILDVPTLAAHCVWLSDEDMEIAKRHNVSPIHNPTSNMKLGSGFAQVQKMLDMGINVTLGTDGAASNNNLNMFEEMHLAAVIHNGYNKDAVMMKPESVLKMATINGAKAQGRKDTGCIEVGKKADIIAIDFRKKPHLYPNFDPMTMLVYAVQASDVSMTMVDGKVLYEDGEYKTLDIEKVLADAAEAVARLYKEA
ncbi:MAG: amidohydrolase family protein, partial [Clostridia bacterium]|nr:amidohydrolase family protein [Clostridia bacterium]